MEVKIMEKITEKHIFKDLDFSDLKRGDIVQNKISGMSYVVTSVNNNHAIGVRQVEITNNGEWRVLIR